ncbi:MAG: TIGR00730 family Rossman fold protein, partial [Prosthecobacter sp.]|nr:TIGR00730 family Rossman fold protein [Prosthecobacter sp.]
EGNSKACSDAAVMLGEEMARQQLTLVYGGSSLGMMGQLAIAMQGAGGKVIGVIPKAMIELEVPLSNLDEMIIVDSMAERKRLMMEKSDAFIAMPGGLGTLEEVFETWSSIRLGMLGNKPLAFLNIENYYDHLFTFMQTCEQFGFVTHEQNRIPQVYHTVPELVSGLCARIRTS